MVLWLAFALLLTTMTLIYYGLFRLSKILYKRNPVWFILFMIFLAPFALILTKASDLLELMWMLLLTPFYGVAVLMALFTNLMIRYYSVTYATLALIHYLFLRRRDSYSFPEPASFDMFWEDKQCGPARTMSMQVRLRRQGEQRWQRIAKSVKKYWDLALVLILIVAVLTTLVGNLDFGNLGIGTVNARDPTYQEALQFIKTDRTDQHQYNEYTYTCVNFATDFKNNALKAGYKAGYVTVFFPDSKTHALDSFNTVDKGLIFVEPQYDGVVTLIIGHPYWDRTRYAPPNYNDTVVGYTIAW